MIESLRTALVAAGLDPDAVAAEAAAIDLNAPTARELRQPERQGKHGRVPAPVTTIEQAVVPAEQLGLDVGEATGVVTIRPGTKRHESLARLRGALLETGDIEFLGEFKAAGLVQGGDTEGWTASPRGEMALGMLDYGSIARAERGKPVTASAAERVSADGVGKYQREGQSETSRAAAIESAPITGRSRLAVLACIHVKGGATDEEIQDALSMNPSTQRPRRVELVEAGAIEDSEARRDTRAGVSAVVWRCTAHGSEAAAEHMASLQAAARV